MDPIWPLPGNSPWRRRLEKSRSRPRPRPRDRPPRPAPPRAQPEPRLDGRGSPLRGGRCKLRGLLGLVVRSWGAGRAVPGGPRADARLSGRLGRNPGGCDRAPRARKSVPWRKEWGAASAYGCPPPSRLHLVRACKCPGTTGQAVDGLLAARRGQKRPPEPRLPVPWAPPDALI